MDFGKYFQSMLDINAQRWKLALTPEGIVIDIAAILLIVGITLWIKWDDVRDVFSTLKKMRDLKKKK